MKTKWLRVGKIIYWFEDHSAGSSSGPEAPVYCAGPVLRVKNGRPIVQSQWDGEDYSPFSYRRTPKGPWVRGRKR